MLRLIAHVNLSLLRSRCHRIRRYDAILTDCIKGWLRQQNISVQKFITSSSHQYRCNFSIHKVMIDRTQKDMWRFNTALRYLPYNTRRPIWVTSTYVTQNGRYDLTHKLKAEPSATAHEGACNLVFRLICNHPVPFRREPMPSTYRAYRALKIAGLSLY